MNKKDLQEIINNFNDEIIDLIIRDLREINPEYAYTLSELIALSTEVEKILSSLPKTEREIIEQYHDRKNHCQYLEYSAILSFGYSFDLC